ncbi:right-handed parallel beta-helix repeat-containing protein [Flagellimonas sp. CMM7]|uniref:right-handed parallel beta-helix repeat-containing protein n=1 Tax=Flagellimonas sp. CMM7 TaxID=2654676 RepID=UPI001F18878A|nr:right-handed parallel beta-helix repeat-containing protein [Flagellimonas sp. CMM7]UII78738.1 right-handed parallel beta-helix repeat-containing protein [Flagellimonas sp. CMM7]
MNYILTVICTIVLLGPFGKNVYGLDLNPSESQNIARVELVLRSYNNLSNDPKIYVVDAKNTKASDANPGTRDLPFLTVQRAAEVMYPGDVCYIGGGFYAETIKFKNSGTKEKPIIFRPLSKEDIVVITGANQIPKDKWEKVSKHIFKAKVTLNLDHENQVFINDKTMVEARWPNVGDDLLKPTLAKMEQGTTPELIVDGQLPQYDYTGAKIWVHASKYWANWTTSIVRNKGKRLEIINTAPFHEPKRHVAAEGAGYYIFSCKDALDAENEWFYDEKTHELFVYREDGKLPTEDYAVKMRMTAFDLRNRSHIHIHGIQLFGATIETNANSISLLFDEIAIKYPYYSSLAESPSAQAKKGVKLQGKNCVLKNSEVAYSSGTGVMLFGENNAVLNCYIHDHDFIGTTASCVELGGKGNIISHCTLTRSGRSVLGFPNMYQALVQNCDMSHSGMLTSDLGLTYGNVIEGGNSEIRFNLMHHNESKHFNMGLYYDHGTKNIISHHNIVYGINRTAFQLNQYAAYHLVYNNTFISKEYGFRNIWGNKYAPELTGVRIVNNVFAESAETTSSEYYWSHNITDYRDFDGQDPFKADKYLMQRGKFISGISRVTAGTKPGIGAIEAEHLKFKVGHDFDNPPKYDTMRSKPLHRNRIVNAAFEHEDHLFPWKIKKNVKRINHKLQAQITEDKNKGRMGKHAIALVSSGSEIFQNITGLLPNATYRFIGFINADNNETAVIGVRYADKSEFISPLVSSKKSSKTSDWRKVNLSFDTDAYGTEVTIFVRKMSSNGGDVYFDDAGLILESK